MKKRRTLAGKLKYFSLLVIVAVSVFFYVPMDVDASASANSLGSASSSATFEDRPTGNAYYVTFYFDTSESSQSRMTPIDLQSLLGDLDSDTYYKVNVTSQVTANISYSLYLSNFSVAGMIGETMYEFNHFPWSDRSTSFVNTNTFDIYVTSDDTTVIPSFFGLFNINNTFGSTVDLSVNMNWTVNSIEAMSSAETDEYQAGYNAGYSTGYADGETSGYSDGFQAGVDSVDTDSYYNSGYQAGVESVDTQSYYDSGYQAGYNAGLQESYQTGYDAGYEDAMSTIESWGADGTNYPVSVYSKSIESDSFNLSLQNAGYTTTNVLNSYTDVIFLRNSTIFDPNHVYRFDVSLGNTGISNTDGTASDYEFFIDVGSRSYSVLPDGSQSFFVNGSDMSSSFLFRCTAYAMFDVFVYNVHFRDFSLVVYDVGPVGNTQNHIANQTDELVNGYDDSAGQETSSQFSDGVAEYEEVEGSIFTSAKSELADYEFFDIESVPAVVTGISFVTATMTGIFNSMGGASGAGIVLSVLFSVMLVSIVAGLYRYFVSSGKGGKHDRKGGNG